MLFAVSSPGAQPGQNPPAMHLDGGATLPLAAHARRVHLLGAVELYAVALYADKPMFNRDGLVSADTPKALRIQVTYEEDPRRGVAIDWRRELIPRLDPAPTAHLRGTFMALRHGDVVIIEYAPAKGTVVRVNRVVAVSGAHHELMLAFLDHWLGQRPVSEDMKRALLG
jgi:hypothetical protein